MEYVDFKYVLVKLMAYTKLEGIYNRLECSSFSPENVNEKKVLII